MPRKYTVSQAVIERNRKGAAATNSLDRYVQRIVESAGELTPEQMGRLRALLRPAGGATE